MNKLLSITSAALLALVAAPSASAQEPAPAPVPGDMVDRLIAVVGDSVVVHSQVEEEIQRLALGGQPVPPETSPEYDALYREVLDRFVDRLLILQAAAKDSLISVDEETVDQLVNESITQLTQQFGGQTALQQALAAEGLTLSEYREFVRNEQRIGRLQQLFVQLRLRDAPPVNITEDELLQRFQEVRPTLQQRPRTVTFRQVVIQPEPSEAAVEAAREKAQALLDSVRGGADFAELAQAHSDDPGTAELGGDLGWFRRGRMVREFEDAAFELFDGQVSDLVRTDFGFHIIKVERYRAGERYARHILIVPETSPTDLERARAEAEDVAASVRSGTRITALADRHTDPAAPDSITMPFEQLAELPPAYSALRTASQGQVLGPLQYEVAPGETRFTVIQVEEIREAGAYTFEDLRPQIASQLQQQRRIEQLLQQLRARTYIDIRM